MCGKCGQCVHREQAVSMLTRLDKLREHHDPLVINILAFDLRVLAANKSFYKLFQVEEKTRNISILGTWGAENGISPALTALLEGILPKSTFFTGFEVNRAFPSIGKKVMLLNGRRIYKEGETSAMLPPIIAAELADYAAKVEGKLNERTQKLETQVKQLQKDIGKLK
jgi:formate hydrogenlyase transcriptional activator